VAPQIGLGNYQGDDDCHCRHEHGGMNISFPGFDHWAQHRHSIAPVPIPRNRAKGKWLPSPGTPGEKIVLEEKNSLAAPARPGLKILWSGENARALTPIQKPMSRN
jgi:hypothetical protein